MRTATARPTPRTFNDLANQSEPTRPTIDLPQAFPKRGRPWTCAPEVEVLPNFTGAIFDGFEVADHVPQRLNEYVAVYASHRLNRRGEPLVKTVGELSEQGQRFDAALARHTADCGPDWSVDDSGFPDYWTC
jgi:hypothetical protein